MQYLQEEAYQLRQGQGSSTSSGVITIATASAGSVGASGAMQLKSGATTSGGSGAVEIMTGSAQGGAGGGISLKVGAGDTGALVAASQFKLVMEVQLEVALVSKAVQARPHRAEVYS